MTPERLPMPLLKCAVAGLALACLVGCAPPPQAPSVPARPVYVTEVRNDAGLDERVFSATLRPRVESELGFRTGGRVTARSVDVGQAVRAGQPLARLDPADLKLAADAAAAPLRGAEIDAAQAESDAARLGRLLADGSVGAADRERQQARADAAKARVAQARRGLELAQLRLGHAVLAAPFDGVVTAVRLEVGQVVAEGQPVITLARPSTLEVVADVPEALASQLREHQASVRVTDAKARSVAWHSLRLRELAPGAAAQTRTFLARFAFVSPPSDSELRIGITAELCLTRDGAVRSAELPASALLIVDHRTSVWVVDEATGALIRRPVRLVSQAANSVRVAGLPDGALVVSAGAHKLDDKIKVRAVRRDSEAIAGLVGGT